MLRDADIDGTHRTILLGQRPRPVPLDPAPGQSSNDASRTAIPSAPRTRTSSSPEAPRQAKTRLNRLLQPHSRPGRHPTANGSVHQIGRPGQHHRPQTRRRSIRNGRPRRHALRHRPRRRHPTPGQRLEPVTFRRNSHTFRRTCALWPGRGCSSRRWRGPWRAVPRRVRRSRMQLHPATDLDAAQKDRDSDERCPP